MRKLLVAIAILTPTLAMAQATCEQERTTLGAYSGILKSNRDDVEQQLAVTRATLLSKDMEIAKLKEELAKMKVPEKK